MSKELRKKIEKVIKYEDVLQLELQSFARDILKNRVNDQKKRRDYLYTILNDPKINKLLNEGKMEDAKSYIKTWVASLN